jgi:predicted PhzF superfamily epimerase YddE/YHI9
VGRALLVPDPGADGFPGGSEDGPVVQVERWRVFPRGAVGGNPCPLVTDARGLAARQMQVIAAHCGHESAFVTSLGGSGAGLRYFVPRHEMRMCVHATIAAVTALAGSGRLAGGRALIRTASGEHRVSWDGADPPAVTVRQLPPRFGPPVAIHADLTAALGMPAGSISPDADGDPAHLVTRQFPVDAGYPEDPATGVAAGALAAYLAGRHRPAQPSWTRITIDQGDAMQAPSRLQAAALAGPDGVTDPSVTGRAVREGQDELSLSSLPAGLPEPELR